MIIYRYLSRQLFLATIVVTSVLVCILVSGRFIKYLAQAAEGRFVVDILWWVLIYRMPDFLQLILPLGLFLGILLTYGRLYLDNEMSVLMACGVSPGQIVRLTAFPALCLSVVVGIFSLYLSPWGVLEVEKLWNAEKTRSSFETLNPGVFHVARNQSSVTYAPQLSSDRRKMEKLFMAHLDSDSKNVNSVVTAATGYRELDKRTGVQYLNLSDGYRFAGIPGRADFRVIQFDHYRAKLSEPSESKAVTEIKAASTLTLWRQNTPEASGELQWRISLPLLVPLLAYLAIPLSRVNPRQGRFLKLIPAMLLYLAYVSALLANVKAVSKGKIDPEWGGWWIHCLVLVLAVYLHGRQTGFWLWRFRSSPKQLDKS